MSEFTGPLTFSMGDDFENYSLEAMKTCGYAIPSTTIKIINYDENGNGEICAKGRNRFMGYYNNEESTLECIDLEGYFHTGDIGYLDSKGNLTITGRLKELIITAGGENISP